MQGVRVPTATYRVQLNQEFTFDDAAGLADYLRDLGVSDLYASPIFKAVPGSTHGYDVTDPTAANPELGGRERLEAMARQLRTRGIGLLLDIVPNHMAAHAANRWWWDVLKHGRGSEFAPMFDIAWDASGRVALPILGATLPELIREGQVRVAWQDGEPVVLVGENALPVGPGIVPSVEGSDASRAPAPAQRPADESAVTALLDRQAYRLEFWKEGIRRINYRRFFDITGLIGVRVEDERTLGMTHSLVLDLLGTGVATGLRIDHIDGLYDPEAYLAKLQELAAARTSRRPWIVVEKILGERESLPDGWPCDGTTGYEVAVALNRLFVDPAGFEAIERHGRAVCGWPASFRDVAWQSKQEVLRTLFVAEVEAAAAALDEIAVKIGRPLARETLREAIIDLTAGLPVYRTYVRSLRIEPRDRDQIEIAFAEAAARRGRGDEAASFLLRVLLLDVPEASRHEALRFVMRWQQLTGPATAKGVEDTALYRYVPLATLNEVGGGPVMQRGATEAFHRLNAERARRWPRALSATSTHDTKRSEDVRARIGVLSELSDEWNRLTSGWRELNAGFRQSLEGGEAPSPSDELILYQSLIGAWPLDGEAGTAFVERIQRYMLKVVREAKVRTSWTDPNEAYEGAVREFTEAILDPSRSRRFLDELRPFEARTAFHGMLNGISQTVLKLAAPGVPDIYRGTELWDLSLVDPDNRRPVDFGVRRDALSEIQGATDRAALASSLLGSWRDGRIKLLITWAGLALRRRVPEPFGGEYAPLEAVGPRAEHLVAFVRRGGGHWVIAAAPRFTVSLTPAGAMPLGERTWGDTRLCLPSSAPLRWRDELTGRTIAAAPDSRTLGVRDVFSTLPGTLLIAEPDPRP